MEITIRVNKNSVLEEVAQKSAYIGAKTPSEDAGQYDRVSTVDEDAPELIQFFRECHVEAVRRLSAYLTREGMDNSGTFYEMVLNVNDRFNRALVPSIELGLYEYFVYGVLAKWCVYTKSDQVQLHAQTSVEMLENLLSTITQRTFQRKSHPF